MQIETNAAATKSCNHRSWRLLLQLQVQKKLIAELKAALPLAKQALT
jgi:hypothetical protein